MAVFLSKVMDEKIGGIGGENTTNREYKELANSSY
jgi:hypothetical protein